METCLPTCHSKSINAIRPYHERGLWCVKVLHSDVDFCGNYFFNRIRRVDNDQVLHTLIMLFSQTKSPSKNKSKGQNSTD